MTGDEDSEVVLNNNSSCTQISSNSVISKNQQVRKNDSTGSNGSSLSSVEDRQVAGVGQGRSTELVSEVSSVSGEPLTSHDRPSKNSVFSENDADIISTTALSNSPSVDSNSEVFISGASTSTSAHCGNGGDPALGGDNGTISTGPTQLTDAQVQDEADHVTLSESELASANVDQMVQVYHQLQNYVQKLKGENQGLKESEEKFRLQQGEASRRENILVMRLATKDQELQDYAAQINELKTAVAPSTSSLKNSLLDPAVNFIIQKMKKELTETKKKLEDTQNDLNAWKFTADSNTGKRLMAKCRMLYQENEDLGRMITSGRLAKLESDLALQKSLTEEMKKAQSEMDDLVLELDEDVEGMQSTILFLQQQLREKISSSEGAATNSSQSSEHLVAVNSSELCAQCRAAQEKKQTVNHISSANSSSPSPKDKVVKMEVDSPPPSHIDLDSGRQQTSINSLENERTFQNGEYSPTRGEQLEDNNICSKRTTRATRHSKAPQSVNTNNTNAESTSTSTPAAQENSGGSSSGGSALNCNKLGATSTTDLQCNTNTTDGNTNCGNKQIQSNSSSASTQEDDQNADSENTVKPPQAKRTKLSGNNNRNNSNSSSDITPCAAAAAAVAATDDTRTVVNTSNARNRNGAVDHA